MNERLLSLHRWLSIAPRGLPWDRQQTYLTVNYSMLMGTLCHLSFIPIFLSIQQFKLAIFNVCFSVPIFVTALFEARKGHSNNAMSLISVELMIHSWYASVTIGTDTAFYIYPLALAALYPMMSWFPLRIRLMATAIPVAFTAVLYAYARSVELTAQLSHAATNLIASYNFICFTHFIIN